MLKLHYKRDNEEVDANREFGRVVSERGFRRKKTRMPRIQSRSGKRGEFRRREREFGRGRDTKRIHYNRIRDFRRKSESEE